MLPALVLMPSKSVLEVNSHREIPISASPAVGKRIVGGAFMESTTVKPPIEGLF